MTDRDREQYMEVLLALSGHGYTNTSEDDNRQSILRTEKERKSSFFDLLFFKKLS